MSLNVNATSSRRTRCVAPLHATAQLTSTQASAAVFQLSARSGAGARSLPGFVSPRRSRVDEERFDEGVRTPRIQRGIAPIGIVTVPPATGAPCADGDVENPAGRSGARGDKERAHDYERRYGEWMANLKSITDLPTSRRAPSFVDTPRRPITPVVSNTR